MHFLGVVHAGTSSDMKLDRAAREVAAICEVMAGRSTQTVLGGDSPLSATTENLIRCLPAATHIHFAGHAFADDAGGVEPHLLISDGIGGDARLEASVIENLHLSAQLVFLAACHSSSGRISDGEGLASPARSFLLAGCRAVVASAWALNDAHSYEFCRILFQLLAEERSTARAFQKAKSSYAATHAHDETWAGLTLIGNSDSARDRYDFAYLGSAEP